MSEYTPTTEEILEEWIVGSEDVEESCAQFYRWFNGEIEKAQKTGADYLFQTLAERGIISLKGDQ